MPVTQDQYVDIVVNGVLIPRMKVMTSQYKGKCNSTGKWFDPGAVIAFKHKDYLTPQQKAAIFGNGTVYHVTVILEQPPLEQSPCDNSVIEQSQNVVLPTKQAGEWTPSVYQSTILDRVLNAIKHIFIMALAGCGKAQPVSATVYTPDGPVKMGDLKIGDFVCTPDGGSAEILGIYPQGVTDIYRIYFSDESYAECTADHLWEVIDSRPGCKAGGVRETKLLAMKLRTDTGRRIYSIPMTKPVVFGERTHSLHPYVFGLLLAEGCLRGRSISVTICEVEIYNRFVNLLSPKYVLKSKNNPVRPCDYYITNGEGESIGNELRRMGLFGKLSDGKFIPQEYLVDSIENRLELLRGLMDGDGTVGKEGHITYSTASCKLAKGVQFLVESLGGTCSFSFKEAWYTYKGVRKQGIRCNISVIDGTQIFTLGYKINRTKVRTKYFPRRVIDRIELARQEESQCI
jgi:hypothetical protein